jgi:hypothetical protein
MAPTSNMEVRLHHLLRTILLLTLLLFRLFFGILPVTKVLWKSEIESQRESYYVSFLNGLDDFIPTPTDIAESYSPDSCTLHDCTPAIITFGAS